MDIGKLLNANVGLIQGLDGNMELMNRQPIDKVGEFYGVQKDFKNDLSKYTDKGISKPEDVAIIESHFVSIGMPIPGGFINFIKLLNGQAAINYTTIGESKDGGSEGDVTDENNDAEGMTKNASTTSRKRGS